MFLKNPLEHIGRTAAVPRALRIHQRDRAALTDAQAVRFGPRYAERYGANMLPSHRRTLADLAACRTPELGWQTFVCNDCGRKHVAYAACGNRHCPTCSGNDREKWLVKRRSEMLPVPYFHLVFTIPKCLRPLFRKHQKLF